MRGYWALWVLSPRLPASFSHKTSPTCLGPRCFCANPSLLDKGRVSGPRVHCTGFRAIGPQTQGPIAAGVRREDFQSCWTSGFLALGRGMFDRRRLPEIRLASPTWKVSALLEGSCLNLKPQTRATLGLEDLRVYQGSSL